MRYSMKNRAADAAENNIADVLIEALPWIKAANGKTIVIKYGGAAMVDADLRRAVMSDVVLMKLVGLNPVLVHGGGNEISSLCEQLGIPVEFKGGMRVTTPETMDIVRMVLVGKVNQDLVAAMNEHGHLAVGMSGSSAGVFRAFCMDPELGRVGRIEEIDSTIIEDLIADEYIPIIASVAVGDDGGYYNLNADVAAGELAAAIGAHKVIYLTDVDGLYKDFSDKSSLIARLSLTEAKELRDSGVLSKGMIPKVDACIRALTNGVPAAHILNGTFPHSMLLEVFTDGGIGTVITRDSDFYSKWVAYPETKLSEKLLAPKFNTEA